MPSGFHLEWFYHNSVCGQKRLVALYSLVDNVKNLMGIYPRPNRHGFFATPFPACVPRTLSEELRSPCRVVASIVCAGGDDSNAYKARAKALLRLGDVINTAPDKQVLRFETFALKHSLSSTRCIWACECLVYVCVCLI